MQKLFVVVLCLLAVVHCDNTEVSSDTDVTDPQEVYDLLLKHLKAEMAQNFDDIYATLTPECTYTFAYWPFIKYEGYEGAHDIYTLLFRLFPDFHYELLEYTIGSNGVACLGKITGHLNPLERFVEWIVPAEAEKVSFISFKQGNFMKWDNKQKKFAGERFYLFFKGAERNIVDQVVHGQEITPPEVVQSMFDAVVSKTSSVEFNVETESMVASLWNSDATTAPAFDSIFTREVGLKVYKNNHDLVTFSSDDARVFYEELRNKDFNRIDSIMTGGQGVLLTNHWLHKRSEDDTDPLEFVAFIQFNPEYQKFDEIRVHLHNDDIEGFVELIARDPETATATAETIDKESYKVF